MSSDGKKKMAKHRGSIFSNTIISALAACLFEIALVLNTSVIDRLLMQVGYAGTLTNFVGDYTMALIGIYLVAGIGVYAFVFGLLQYRDIRYLRRISTALLDVSEGNFERRVPVVGDDELSDIALQLNHMTEEIQLLMEKEKDNEQTKNDLITNIAHDLRTPLTSIIGYLNLIISQPDMDDSRRQAYLKVAYDKSLHLQKMIEDLFGFTKLNYGKQTTMMQPIDIIELMGQLLEEFYPVFEENGIEYEYRPAVASQLVMGDGTLLARLFDNLINNAVKYGKDGKRLLVKAELKGKYIAVSVINYGKVIPKKDLDRVFEKFYRAEQSRSSSTGGTGLGLAIAKNITLLHNGIIRASSGLDGTVFEVELPVLDQKRKPEQKKEEMA